jgi:Peptidase propeptide and YPEB domain
MRECSFFSHATVLFLLDCFLIIEDVIQTKGGNMMKFKKTLIIGGIALGLAGGAFFYQGTDGMENVLASTNGNESKLIEEAKISEAEAEKIAKEEASGEVTEKDVEKENGTIVYEFDIKTEAGETEVEIDGMNGEVLQVEVDDEDDEDDEDDDQQETKSSQ